MFFLLDIPHPLSLYNFSYVVYHRFVHLSIEQAPFLQIYLTFFYQSGLRKTPFWYPDRLCRPPFCYNSMKWGS